MLQAFMNNPQQGMQNLISMLQNPQSLHALLTNPQPAYMQQMNTAFNPLQTVASFNPDAQKSIAYSNLELRHEQLSAQNLSSAGNNLSDSGTRLMSGDLSGAWDKFSTAAGNMWDAAGNQARAISYNWKAGEHADLAGQSLNQSVSQFSAFLSPTMVSAMNNLTGGANPGAALTQSLNNYNTRLDQMSPTILGRNI